MPKLHMGTEQTTYLMLSTITRSCSGDVEWKPNSSYKASPIGIEHTN